MMAQAAGGMLNQAVHVSPSPPGINQNMKGRQLKEITDRQ